jgi:hypothetical protein
VNILAIYAVNLHLADLQEEARQNRLVADIPKRPSLLRRFATALRSAATASQPSSAAASAA